MAVQQKVHVQYLSSSANPLAFGLLLLRTAITIFFCLARQETNSSFWNINCSLQKGNLVTQCCIYDSSAVTITLDNIKFATHTFLLMFSGPIYRIFSTFSWLIFRDLDNVMLIWSEGPEEKTTNCGRSISPISHQNQLIQNLFLPNIFDVVMFRRSRQQTICTFL